MKVLIKNALIVCPSSPFHGKKIDILIIEGKFKALRENITESVDTIIDQPDTHVSLGWTDLFANFAEPGYEYKETLETGSKAAASGGFTTVAIIPNTNPVVDNKAQIEYISKKQEQFGVNILPIGAITKSAAGKELSEMYDMKNSGAIAFSDGTYPVQSSGILVKALQYVKAFNGLIIQLPEDKTISNKGLINEGIISTRLGLAGNPSIAEEIMVARDLELVKYTNSRLHITGISSKRSLKLIEEAKANGINISCSVTPYHLFFEDNDLNSYDTNLKVNPPIRTNADREALREGVINGVIDCIATHHSPHEWDSKITEFEYAKSGMIGLESAFSALLSSGIPSDTFVKMQTENIQNILGLSQNKIEVGEIANITLFNPSSSNTFSVDQIKSKSKNSPFIGKQLKGHVIGIINNDKLFLN